MKGEDTEPETLFYLRDFCALEDPQTQSMPSTKMKPSMISMAYSNPCIRFVPIVFFVLFFLFFLPINFFFPLFFEKLCESVWRTHSILNVLALLIQHLLIFMEFLGHC